MSFQDQRVTVSSKDFTAFISAILNVYRGGATLVIHKDYIDCLVLSEDNASIILYGKILILDNSLPNEVRTINVRDLSKFTKLIDFSKEEAFTFRIKNNYVYYENKKIGGAKFILDENPARKINNTISVEWFNRFETYFKANLKRENLKEITQLSSFANNSEKLYVYEENNMIVAELNDKEKVNIDSIKLNLTDDYEGHIYGNIILNIDTLASLSNMSENLVLEVAKIQNSEALFFTINNTNVLLKYLFASKVK